MSALSIIRRACIYKYSYIFSNSCLCHGKYLDFMEGDTHTSFLKNNILFLFISYRLMDYFLYMQLTINFFKLTNFHCIHQSYTSNFGIILMCVWCNPCLFGGELAGRLHQQVLQNAIWRRSKQHVNYRKEHLFTCISHLVCFTPCRV